MIWLILLLGFVLRVINLNQSLWLDEATQVILSSKSLYSIVFERNVDFHPPLSYIFYHFWMFFGHFEVWLRLLPVLFGIATIFVVYKLIGKIFDSKVALLSAFLLAIAPYHIYYSQEVRMYSMVTFFAAMSMYFFNFLKDGWKFRLGYVLSSSALIYTHYGGLFLLVAQLLFILCYKRKVLGNFLQLILFLIISYIPWLPFFWEQLKNGVNIDQYLPGWRDVLGVATYKAIPLVFIKFSIGRISFENHLVYGLVFCLVVVIFGLAFLRVLQKIKESNIKLIFFWLLIPVALAIIISIKIPLDQPFRLLYVLPAFYILIAIGILNSARFKRFLLAGVILISVFSLSIYYGNQRFWREDWKGAVRFVNNNHCSQCLSLFGWSEPFAPVQWYKIKMKGYGILDKFPAEEDSLKKKNLLLANIDKVFFFEYLQGLSDPKHLSEKWLQLNGFNLIEKYDFRGVGFVLKFERNVH